MENQSQSSPKERSYLTTAVSYEHNTYLKILFWTDWDRTGRWKHNRLFREQSMINTSLSYCENRKLLLADLKDNAAEQNT